MLFASTLNICNICWPLFTKLVQARSQGGSGGGGQGGSGGSHKPSFCEPFFMKI